jgi:PAS domain S-box-containing protein
MQISKTEILLIEDNPSDVSLINEMLSEAGSEFSVQHVQSLPDGLQLLQERKFDLVLVDLGLPESQGLDAALAVRRQSELTPVVALVLQGDAETAMKSLAMDIQDYLVKGEITGSLLSRSIRFAIQRKRDSESLRESEELRRIFFDYAPAAVAMFDCRMRYILASRRWCKDYGLGEQDVRGVSHYEIFPEISAAWKEAHRRGLSGEVLHAEADLFERADGSAQWVRWEIHPWYRTLGEIGGIVIFAEDITETRKNVEHIRKLSKAVERSPVSIVITDSRGAIEYVNPKFTELTGYTLEESLGQNPRILKSGQTPPEIYKDLWNTIMGGKEWQGEFLNRKGDGEYYWEAASISPILDEEGQITHFIAVKEDITERKKSEEEIKRLNANLEARAAELETANRDLEAFNYTVAHDLRQPLNVVSSYCQAIGTLCGDQLQDECRGYVLEARNGTLRMNQLIEALLDFSRLAHVEPRRETVNLSVMAHEVAKELKLVEPGQQVDLRIADGIVANGDPTLLRVVLVNLLGNAWKYSRLKEQAVIEFDVTENDGKQVFFVRDNGPGFDMSDGDLLFTPFQRLPGTEEYRGFGIGLATVERIIKRHGGKVWAEAAPDKGATFYFALP